MVFDISVCAPKPFKARKSSFSPSANFLWQVENKVSCVSIRKKVLIGNTAEIPVTGPESDKPKWYPVPSAT